ncbi:MAG: MBL fold metallo-hydrolase [Solirubrobacteraceae bacterium]|nr:MBL fold metallo-hydrolase [Solirubrobacteraceae bacterium]
MPYQSSTLTQIVQFGVVNAYLVREDDGLTLIDGLIGNQTKRILAAAERMGAPIKRVTITHAHPDHVGAIDKILAAVPDAEFVVGERESKSLNAHVKLEPGEPKGLILPGNAGVKTVPNRLVNAGDTIGSLQVHAAPGHSVGQVAFLDPRDGTLICGDAYSTVGGVATTAGPYLKFPLPGSFTWHKPTALETAKALRALDPSRLAPGHGRVVEQPGAAMDAAIARKS